MLTAQKTEKVPDDLMAQLRMLRDLPEYRAAMEETEALIAARRSVAPLTLPRYFP